MRDMAITWAVMAALAIGVSVVIVDPLGIFLSVAYSFLAALFWKSA